MVNRKYTVDEMMDSTCNTLWTSGSTASAWNYWRTYGGHAARLPKFDRSRIPEWIERLREGEAEIRELRMRLEGLAADRACDYCSAPMSGRADRRYCCDACRKGASRQSRLQA